MADNLLFTGEDAVFQGRRCKCLKKFLKNPIRNKLILMVALLLLFTFNLSAYEKLPGFEFEKELKEDRFKIINGFRSIILPGWGQAEKGDYFKTMLISGLIAGSLFVCYNSEKSYEALRKTNVISLGSTEITFKPASDAKNTSLFWGSVAVMAYLINVYDGFNSEYEAGLKLTPLSASLETRW